jgi:plasmid maintenance system antidote protein VapI
MNSNRLLMIHPGRILLEEFLAPKGISVWHLAKDIGVSVRRVYEIARANARSTPTSLTASRITSACRNAFGSNYRRGMTGNKRTNYLRCFQENDR